MSASKNQRGVTIISMAAENSARRKPAWRGGNESVGEGVSKESINGNGEWLWRSAINRRSKRRRRRINGVTWARSARGAYTQTRMVTSFHLLLA
jgi:hypothetical protein